MCWSERMDGLTTPDSIWLMNPFVSSFPASWAWLSPASRRAERTRSPSVRPPAAVEVVPPFIDRLGSVAIITMHDTEHRWAPTMGSVVEMRVIRSTVLAFVVALTLAAGLVSTGNADEKTPGFAHRTANANTHDPGD